MAEALYRKYRPQIFEDVVGQEHIERTIKNAIEQDKVSHAYLFCGPRGTGKTTTARLLAKALLCEKGPTPEPDGTCDDCVMIANGEHPDVYELDAASRTGVENVREEIIGRVQFAPTRGRYKIYIIDEVHMLSTAAFNALLKTLEEPPSHVVFILATTDPQKVPETIHSRCQRFDFRRISAEAIVSRLGAICVAEGVEFEGEALDLIAHRAGGGLRNALTSLEQLIAFGEGNVTMEVAERLLGSLDSSDLAAIVSAIGTRDVAACFRWTAEYVETGADLAQFVRDLAEHMRNMYVLALAGDEVALEVGESERRELVAELPLFGPDRLARLLGVLGDVSAELKTSTNPRLSFEIALTRMVRPDSDLTLESLAERVEALESGHSAVAHVVSVAPAASAATAVGASAAVAAGAATGNGVAAASGVATASNVGGVAGGAMGATPQAASVAGGVASTALPAEPTRGCGACVMAAGEEAPMAQARAAAVGGTAAGGAVVPGGYGEASGAQASPSSDAESVSHETFGRDVSQAAPSANDAGGNAGLPTVGGAPSANLLASLQNPAALQRVWQAALTTLKKNKAAYGALFLNTKAVYDAARTLLVVEFPAENTFAFKAVQKPEVQDALYAALQQACGEPLAVTYAQAGSGTVVPVATAVSQQPVQRSAQPQQQVAQPRQQAASQPEPAAQLPSTLAQQQPAPRAQAQQTQPAQQAQTSQRQSQQPAQAQQRPQSPASAGAGSFAAPEPDFAPIDVYDDMVPYDDEPVPYASASASFEQATVPAAAAARTSGLHEAAAPSASTVPAAASASAAAATAEAAPSAFSSASAPESASASADADNLEALLSSSFGGDVILREVRE